MAHIVAVFPGNTGRHVVLDGVFVVAGSKVQPHGLLRYLSIGHLSWVPVAFLSGLAVFVHVVEVGEDRHL